MTASEQQAECAAASTPTIGSKLRAAIEADVLRRAAADPSLRNAGHSGISVTKLRAEADRIEEGAR